eukprot:symbB.v1.2.008704.t1/scaffold543.1/size336731/17
MGSLLHQPLDQKAFLPKLPPFNPSLLSKATFRPRPRHLCPLGTSVRRWRKRLNPCAGHRASWSLVLTRALKLVIQRTTRKTAQLG